MQADHKLSICELRYILVTVSFVYSIFAGYIEAQHVACIAIQKDCIDRWGRIM